MSPKDPPEGIGCEEAQNLANLYFNGLGGDVVKRPYLQHIELCERCQAIHQRWVAWLWELGEVIGDAFGYVPPEVVKLRERKGGGMLFSKNGARMRRVGGIFFLRDRELRAVQEAELTGRREKTETRLETERHFPETGEVITEGKHVVRRFQYVEVKCPFCGERYKRRAEKACLCGAVETELILRGSQFAIFSEELELRT